MRRRITRRKRGIRMNKGATSSVFMWFMIIIFLFSALIVGGLKSFPEPDPSDIDSDPILAGVSCCDTGNGNNCTIVAGSSIMFNGEPYGLLKSGIKSAERGKHITPTNQYANSQEIFINVRNSNSYEQPRSATCVRNADWYASFKPDGTSVCYGVPDDELIFVCKSSNPPNLCRDDAANALWDVYFRERDLASPGIPDFIKNCNNPADPGPPPRSNNRASISREESLAGADPAVINPATPASALPTRNSLQLETFSLTATPAITGTTGVVNLAPFCKPAIYLYPETTLPINVQVYPVGNMTLTIPKYPATGWNVIAHATGALSYHGTGYDYLYYEAEIPDSVIVKPNEGYVSSAEELEETLGSLLSKLGLNKKESTQFKEYWVGVLPKAPYYKISVIEQNNIDTIAPLVINPAPQTVIRVGIYFEALEEKIAIDPPILAPVSRNGFTVVEWGGFFKRDKNHPFSCFM